MHENALHRESDIKEDEKKNEDDQQERVRVDPSAGTIVRSGDSGHDFSLVVRLVGDLLGGNPGNRSCNPPHWGEVFPGKMVFSEK